MMMFNTIRDAYKFLQMEKELVEEGKIPSLTTDRVAIMIKREIRDFRDKTKEPWRTAVKNDYDSVWFKFALPEAINTEEQAEDWFDRWERIEAKPSQYDCTGQQFTARYKLFQKPDGRWWCYHLVCIDV